MANTVTASVSGPHPANGPGALDYYTVDCEACGPVLAYSLPTMARQAAREHEAWHAKKK